LVPPISRMAAPTADHHFGQGWKHGVLGSDLPGVLVIEAQR